MTPAEIAAKLTPAQVRALRDPINCTDEDFEAFCLDPITMDLADISPLRISPLGREVLAVIEEAGK